MANTSIGASFLLMSWHGPTALWMLTLLLGLLLCLLLLLQLTRCHLASVSPNTPLSQPTAVLTLLHLLLRFCE